MKTSNGFVRTSNSSDRKCEFCGDFEHFGICDEMRAVQQQQTAELKPVVNPHVRHG